MDWSAVKRRKALNGDIENWPQYWCITQIFESTFVCKRNRSQIVFDKSIVTLSRTTSIVVTTYLSVEYEYWLSKEFWRCSVKKTFADVRQVRRPPPLQLLLPRLLAFLASSLSCHNKQLRNWDIFHLGCFCLSLFLEILVSVLFFKNLNPQLFWPDTKRS